MLLGLLQILAKPWDQKSSQLQELDKSRIQKLDDCVDNPLFVPDESIQVIGHSRKSYTFVNVTISYSIKKI